ncbi:MAG: hypothetical protein WA092_03220 [Minisyncoccales bacterium]
MFKRILLFVLIISFLSVGFCFAFDGNSIKTIWDEWFPKIAEYWNIFLNWINNDMKPWIEKSFGVEVRQEFERELSEIIKDVPLAIQDIWNKAKELF